MAKKKKKQISKEKIELVKSSLFIKSPGRQTLLSTGLYFVIASALTFPLIFRMNSSIYGPYDHVTTDLFTIIYSYFWWIKESILNLKVSPFNSPLLAAPFGTRLTFSNITGLIQLPLTVLFGHLFSRNFTILFNLVVAGLGMFLLVRYITKSAGAGFIAGIIFAFCPNMLVRSYTTFDSTQVQWIPLYTLFVIKFINKRTWKNAVLTCVFLICHILFSFPYYLMYLPVHTIVLLATFAAWHIRQEKAGIGGFVRGITSPDALKAWMKIGVVLMLAIIVFVIFYFVVIGGGGRIATAGRTTAQLEELALKPADYLMPHPRSALLKGNIKQSYWDAKRPGKNPDSFVSYIGYIAIAFMILGIIKGRGNVKWFCIAGAVIAFWSTMGPNLFGLPTPSGLIHKYYASFARRILIYKVFVQMYVAVLAGMGISFVLNRLRSNGNVISFLTVLSVAIIAEYALVPPALSVNLNHTPIMYQRIRDLPDDSIIIEVPPRRHNNYIYQGYLYYQIAHGKRLFNRLQGFDNVPEHIKPFYDQMEVPIEACEYCNLAVLRYLGVTHLTYHWFIGTTTVGFASLAAPALDIKSVEGLKLIFESKSKPAGTYPYPFDYIFADLYEITVEPCPVALTFDYHSPYEPISGVIGKNKDFRIPVGSRFTMGWVSALFYTASTFYYPIPVKEKVDRVFRQGGRITATNLSDEPVDFNITFLAESPDSGCVFEAKWNEKEVVGTFEIGPQPTRCMVESIRLEGGTSGVLSIWSNSKQYDYSLAVVKFPARGVVRDFRVILKEP